MPSIYLQREYVEAGGSDELRRSSYGCPRCGRRLCRTHSSRARKTHRPAGSGSPPSSSCHQPRDRPGVGSHGAAFTLQAAADDADRITFQHWGSAGSVANCIVPTAQIFVHNRGIMFFSIWGLSFFADNSVHNLAMRIIVGTRRRPPEQRPYRGTPVYIFDCNGVLVDRRSAIVANVAATELTRAGFAVSPDIIAQLSSPAGVLIDMLVDIEAATRRKLPPNFAAIFAAGHASAPPGGAPRHRFSMCRKHALDLGCLGRNAWRPSSPLERVRVDPGKHRDPAVSSEPYLFLAASDVFRAASPHRTCSSTSRPSSRPLTSRIER